MSRSLCFASLISLSLGACTFGEEEIWMPPSASGKADGVTILDGASIPSQHVDASKRYFTGRSMDSLRQVGALTGAADELAMRADGIIANLPANGRMEAAELVRMEDPAIFATLFPSEKAELPNVWKHLVAPGPNAIPASAPPNDLTVTNESTPPGPLQVPASLAISSLPAELQTVAARVQLVFDGDSTGSTIQIADIDQVLLMPQAFTPAEVTQLNTIKRIFIERATSDAEAKVVVPTPGHFETTTSIGAISLTLASTIKLIETRSYSTLRNNVWWNGGLQLHRTQVSTLHMGAQDKVIAIELDSGNEAVFETPESAVHGTGHVVFERYTNGQRQETNDVEMPPFAPGITDTRIDEFLDYKLVTAAQAPLFKNVKSTSEHTVVFEHELAAAPPPPHADTTLVANVATPALSLPTGRYAISTNTNSLPLVIEIYPQSVMIMRYATEFAPLRFEMVSEYGGSSYKRLHGRSTGASVYFTPSTNQVLWTFLATGLWDNLTIDASMRLP